MADRSAVTIPQDLVLIGVVAERDGMFYRVVVKAPEKIVNSPEYQYLTQHLLTVKQLGGAEVGDAVELRYITTTKSSGLWWVTKVIE